MAKYQWQNWSGIVKSKPRRIAYPKSEKAIQKLVRKAAKKGQRIRVVGSGHSWTPLCQTDQILVSLDEYQGVQHVDLEKAQATVCAGSKLHYLGAALHEFGLSMENLGDIDVQSIAGAISTGTHGTGMAFGSLSTQIVGLRLVLADGEILNCSNEENQEIFKAAQLSLGTLGIISEVTIQCVPAYKLHYYVDKEDIFTCLTNLEVYNKENRNFEFYWFPHTNLAQTKFSNITDLPIKEDGVGRYLNDVVLENGFFGAVSAVSAIIPNASPVVAKITAKGITRVEKINWSHKIYATPRYVKFNEMEYNVPLESFKDVFAEIQHCFKKKNFKIHFPLENRFGPEEDIYLSSAYGRKSAYISVHAYKAKPYKQYFKTLEAIFLNHNGRPHWAKLHNLKAEELSEMYPRWQDFTAIRDRLDPKGMFLNGYLTQLFGAKTVTNRV